MNTKQKQDKANKKLLQEQTHVIIGDYWGLWY